MSDLFPSCVAVLEKELRPIHYAELTERALANLRLSKTDCEWSRVKEDVREKLLLKGVYGTSYIGRPYYFGVLREWFPGEQASFNLDIGKFTIPLRSDICIAALKDAVYRFYYMVTRSSKANTELTLLSKTAESVLKECLPDTEVYRKVGKILPSLDNRIQAAARGKLIEHHVSYWFSKQWPDAFCDPPNVSDPTRPCPYDFSLVFGSKSYKLDVAGPNKNEKFGDPYRNKRSAGFHVFASLRDYEVVLHGFQSDKEFKKEIFEAYSLPLTWLIVFFNCISLGFPYVELKQMVLGASAYKVKS